MPLILYMEGQIKIVLKGDNVTPWGSSIRRKRIVLARDMEGRPILVNAKNIILAIEKDQAEYDAEIEEAKKAAEAQQSGNRLARPMLIPPRKIHG